MIYAVTGATGHIGHRIAELLLKKHKKVRVIGRSADKLQPLVTLGAEAFTGSLEDSAFLSQAFDKVEAVFAMIPPNPKAEDFRAFQNRVGESIATAVEKAGVRRVVNLSSQGAHLPEGTGPIVGLYDQEQRLNAIEGLHVVHLRPTFFMENLMMNIDLIRNQNINGTPMKSDLVFPAVATRDIAAVAADYLLRLEFTGKSVRDLLGERDLSMNEMTKILGQAIGKPDLPYVQFPYDAAEKAMIDMGLSRNLAGLYIEMYHAFNEGLIMSGTTRTPESTTKTSFEAFAKDFVAVYKKV
jgi:uncharacterized protein YbjT (DUF2867 family)